MKTVTGKFCTALRFMRDFLDKKDIPSYWLEFILLIHEAGDQGATTKEVAEDLGMTQGIASRMVKIMSSYHDRETGKIEGWGVLGTMNDDVYRHRQRVYLTFKGKELMAGVKKILES